MRPARYIFGDGQDQLGLSLTRGAQINPGDIIREIRECLDQLGANVTNGATALGATRATLSRLINRKAGGTAGFWLRLQLNYDLARAQARSGKIRARRLGTPAQIAREES